MRQLMACHSTECGSWDTHNAEQSLRLGIEKHQILTVYRSSVQCLGKEYEIDIASSGQSVEHHLYRFQPSHIASKTRRRGENDFAANAFSSGIFDCADGRNDLRTQSVVMGNNALVMGVALEFGGNGSAEAGGYLHYHFQYP
jgi:hypothetical protein